MVGGFSESPMLQKRIQESVPQDKKFIIPKEPGLAVLKGAVIFGHNPLVIEARRARYTYGVGTSVIFEEGTHPDSRRITSVDGEDYCTDIFDEHVTIGQELVFGKTNMDREYSPLNKDQERMTFAFYASTDPNPAFVTDANCTEIGQFTVDLADSDDDRAFSVTMVFGDTELHAEAVEMATGMKTKCVLYFLG
ncbi:heat shock 70 kDa protein 12A-like [Dreissena polymorpha]|uniref:heat shock 70 kDa protein 12A-like n=1 Tax=Dreissena polymorpha TaxID=45954 RepID=UPI0022645924|nr:heat shock 70 kDa protein 12A-like [Dreissena polymorpha]